MILPELEAEPIKICRIDHMTYLEIAYPCSGGALIVASHQLPQYDDVEWEVIASLTDRQLNDLVRELKAHQSDDS
jgi:hypothetical protein